MYKLVFSAPTAFSSRFFLLQDTKKFKVTRIIRTVISKLPAQWDEAYTYVAFCPLQETLIKFIGTIRVL